jgi:hypothetical protein
MTALRTLDGWFGNGLREAFNPIDLSVAHQFARKNPSKSWDECRDYAIAQRGKQEGYATGLTQDQAVAVVEKLQSRPDLELRDAIYFARQEYPDPDVIYGRSTAPTSEQRYADAQRSDARETALRTAWENLCAHANALGVDAEKAAAAMKYQSTHGGSWREALNALADQPEGFTEDDLRKALDLMKREPAVLRRGWDHIRSRVKAGTDNP